MVEAARAEGARAVELRRGLDVTRVEVAELVPGATATISLSRGTVEIRARDDAAAEAARHTWLAPCEGATLQRAPLDEESVAALIARVTWRRGRVAIVADPATRVVSVARAVIAYRERGLEPTLVLRRVGLERCLSDRPAPAAPEAAVAPGEVPRLLQTASEGGPAGDSAGDQATGRGREKAQLAATIRASLGLFTACYEEALARRRNLAGKVALGLWVLESGAVESCRVEHTTAHDPPLEACLVARMQGLSFPPEEGAGRVHVIYPFIFSSTSAWSTRAQPDARPEVRVAPPSLEEAEVLAVLLTHQPLLEPCVAAAGARPVDATVAKLAVDRTGRVTAAELIAGRSADDRANACLVEHLQKIVFPPPPGRQAVVIEARLLL